MNNLAYEKTTLIIFSNDDMNEYCGLVDYNPWYSAEKSANQFSRYLLNVTDLDETYVAKKHRPVHRMGYLVYPYETWMAQHAEAWLAPYDWQAWDTGGRQFMLTTAPEYYVRAFLNAVRLELVEEQLAQANEILTSPYR